MKKIVSSAALTLSIAFGISTPSQGLSYNPVYENDPCVGSDLYSAIPGNKVSFKKYENKVIVTRALSIGAIKEDIDADTSPDLNYSLKVAIPSKSVSTISFNNYYIPYTGTPNQTNTETYSAITSNDFKHAKDEPLSTVSIDVDTASYTNVRRYLNTACLPPKNAVRIEEMVNYFSYDYPQPTNNDPFSITTELSSAPWNKDHQLLHVGIQGKQLDLSKAPSSNLVFLIDTSGSMQDDLDLVKDSLKMLVEQLRATDKIAIVTYSGYASLALPSTSGANKELIVNAIDSLKAGGSTAGGEGIQQAYRIAKQNFIHGGNNRIMLATDGDFNVGVSTVKELEDFIISKRDDHVFLSVLGFGRGNYQDDNMETLADIGNGNYAYIDNLLEAKKVLVKEMDGTLYTIAKDVKIQIEFNPEKVKSYRLIGYENRKLNKEDFNDDKKDAGELGAGHTVTALYEIIPANASGIDSNVDELKYQTTTSNQAAMNSNELVNVKLRYKEPTSSISQLIVKPVVDNKVAFAQSSNNFRFSSAVAGFGMLLRDSKFKGDISYQAVIDIAKHAKGKDLEGYRSEFVQLVEKAEMVDKMRKKG
jgi:Ca-activated chloride channel family protein